MRKKQLTTVVVLSLVIAIPVSFWLNGIAVERKPFANQSTRDRAVGILIRAGESRSDSVPRGTNCVTNDSAAFEPFYQRGFPFVTAQDDGTDCRSTFTYPIGIIFNYLVAFIAVFGVLLAIIKLNRLFETKFPVK